jgi:hypothetical protein
MKAPIRSEIVSSLLINVAFGLLIAVALTFVQHPLAYFYSKREVSGAVLSQAQMTSRMEANGLSDEDPVARFLTTRIGHVLFARQDNDFCQRALFDNRSGLFQEASEIQCLRNIKAAAGAVRLDALQKAFKSRN